MIVSTAGLDTLGLMSRSTRPLPLIYSRSQKPQQGAKQMVGGSGKAVGVGLTYKQKTFVDEMTKNPNGSPADAAKVAGYAQPEVAASNLMNPDKYPLVAGAVRDALFKAQQESAKQGIDALKQPNDILSYIQTVMYFQPLQFFLPGDKGGWLISEEDFKLLPPAIGCLIESIERRVSRVSIGKGENATVREEITFWVRLVSKTKAMELAAKHQLGTLLNVQGKVFVDWDSLTRTSEQVSRDLTDDPIERRIRVMEAKALPAAHSSNGEVHDNGDGN